MKNILVILFEKITQSCKLNIRNTVIKLDLHLTLPFLALKETEI